MTCCFAKGSLGTPSNARDTIFRSATSQWWLSLRTSSTCVLSWCGRHTILAPHNAWLGKLCMWFLRKSCNVMLCSDKKFCSLHVKVADQKRSHTSKTDSQLHCHGNVNGIPRRLLKHLKTILDPSVLWYWPPQLRLRAFQKVLYLLNWCHLGIDHEGDAVLMLKMPQSCISLVRYRHAHTHTNNQTCILDKKGATQICKKKNINNLLENDAGNLGSILQTTGVGPSQILGDVIVLCFPGLATGRRPFKSLCHVLYGKVRHSRWNFSTTISSEANRCWRLARWNSLSDNKWECSTSLVATRNLEAGSSHWKNTYIYNIYIMHHINHIIDYVHLVHA